MPEFYTWVILQINHLGDFGKKQLSGFGIFETLHDLNGSDEKTKMLKTPS